MSKAELKLDWCDYKAAKYAVEHWHYSKRMPVGKCVKIGVWENNVFIGCIIYAQGNTPTLGKAYGLEMTECCELVRVALNKHESTYVTRIIAISIKFLKRACPNLKLIVSFADPSEGHHGGIYQGGNWLFCGDSSPSWQWFHDGRWKHNREMTSGAFGQASKVKDYKMLPKRETLGKHRYLYPLTQEMRDKIEPLRKPYPKRAL